MAVVMMFRLKTAPTTLERVIQEIFADYIPTFMQVFLDDFVVHTIVGSTISRTCNYV